MFALACSGAAGDGEASETDTGGPVERTLCDGSQDLRLIWAFAGGGQLLTELQREGGFSYLYVRGDCRYWVLPFQKPPTIEAFETHTGVLDADAEAALVEQLSYGQWDDLLGFWDHPNTYDVLIALVHDGEQWVACRGDCPDAPAQVRSFSSAANAEFLALWEAGESLADAPMRVLAAAPAEPPDPDVFDIVPWTVDLDLGAIAVDEALLVERGVAALVDDPEVATALRAFRLEHAKPLSYYSEFFVEVEPGEVYQLFLRDALPFEDENGLVELPMP